MGIDHVGLNCAGCHTGTVRDTPQSPPRIVLGMPAHQLDLQSFVEFVLECSLDNRMTAETVRGRLPDTGGPSTFERLLLRAGFIDRLKLQTLDLRNRISPLLDDAVPRWGRGRVDTFNPYKAIQFNWALDRLPPSELIGASDFPSLWNQQPREGMQLHWDGDNDSVDERNLSAGLGAGITPATVDHAGFEARARLDLDAAAPAVSVCRGPGTRRTRGGDLSADVPRVSRRPPFSRRSQGWQPHRAGRQGERHRHRSVPAGFVHCGVCGESIRPLPGIPVPLPPVPEDRRVREPSTRRHLGSCPLPAQWVGADAAGLVGATGATTPGLLQGLRRVRPRAGLASFPTVAEEGGRRYFRYDTSVPGNSNAGHLYGVSLPDEDKQAVVEYLKTF